MNRRTKQIIALTFALFALAGLQSFSLPLRSGGAHESPAAASAPNAPASNARATQKRTEPLRDIAHNARPARPGGEARERR